MKFKLHTNPDYLLIDGVGPVHCLQNDLLELWEQLDELFRKERTLEDITNEDCNGDSGEATMYKWTYCGYEGYCYGINFEF